MKTAGKNDFSAGSVPRTILKMAGPITLAEIVNVLYNIVDRMYIGRMPGDGAMALAGLGICMPFTMVVSAFARLCGEGGAPICSIERGRGNLDRAARVQGNSFAMLVAAGLMITLLGSLLMKPVLLAFGADGETLPYAAAYCRIYLLGSTAVMISLGMNHYINAQGYARIGMATVAIGAVINIVLDPVLIYGLHMGVSGAALASVIAQAVSAAWVLRFLTGKRAIVPLRTVAMKPDGELIRRILALGTAGFVVGLTNSAVQAAANRVLGTIGGGIYISVQTIIASVREVISMPIMGLSSGAKPVIGFNYGARRFDRVRESIRFTTLAALAYNTCAWILVLLLPAQLMGIFTGDAALIETGIVPFRAYYACYVFMTFQTMGQSCYSAMGFAKQSIFFSVFRKIVLVVPLMLILPKAAALGALGVFLAEPISEVIGGMFSYGTMYFTIYRNLGKKQLHGAAD